MGVLFGFLFFLIFSSSSYAFIPSFTKQAVIKIDNISKITRQEVNYIGLDVEYEDTQGLLLIEDSQHVLDSLIEPGMYINLTVPEYGSIFDDSGEFIINLSEDILLSKDNIFEPDSDDLKNARVLHLSSVYSNYNTRATLKVNGAYAMLFSKDYFCDGDCLDSFMVKDLCSNNNPQDIKIGDALKLSGQEKNIDTFITDIKEVGNVGGNELAFRFARVMVLNDLKEIPVLEYWGSQHVDCELEEESVELIQYVPKSAPMEIVAPIVCPTLFNLPLSRGLPSREMDVKILQVMLNFKNKASLSIDGVFGFLTESAVRQFQATQGINQNGLVDMQTYKRLVCNI